MAPAKRGPKEKPKRQPRRPLTPKAPAGLSADVKRLYKAIATELAAEGWGCEIDTNALVLLVETEDRKRQLQTAVDNLNGNFTILTKTGLRSHPLLGELRAAQNQCNAYYNAFMMTPRARTSARMTEGQARQAGAAAQSGSDKSHFFNPEEGE